MESLLGAIFEIYLRNGFIGGAGVEKTNLTNIFSESVKDLLLEYYGENESVMAVIGRYCFIRCCTISCSVTSGTAQPGWWQCREREGGGGGPALPRLLPSHVTPGCRAAQLHHQ